MMWLFFSNGFVSIVAHRGRPDSLLVRSRNMCHLKSLFPNATHFTLDYSDYPHRSIVHRKDVAETLTNYIMCMQYDNFKNSIVDSEFRNISRIIWSILYQYGMEYRRSVK